MSSVSDILNANIPKVWILRFFIIFTSLVAMGVVSLMIYIPFVRQASGETSGEAVMQRGGCVAALLPFSLAAASASSAVAVLNRSRLSLGWLIIGNLPAAVLALALLGALLWGVVA